MFSSSKTIQFLLPYLFFYNLCDFVQAEPPYQTCSNSIVSTNSALFQYNLGTLLSYLSSNASVSNFYNASVGDDRQRLYGQFLCYKYVSQDKCVGCIASASKDIQRLCPNNNEAVVWEENCQLCYSDKPVTGHLDLTGNIWKDNTENVTEPDRYISLVNGLLQNITKLAAFNASADMVATGKVNYSETEEIYAFVQCTPDLSPNNCNSCLEAAIGNTSSCCSKSRGARLLSRSCYLRYEFYDFFESIGGNSSQNYNKTASTQKEKWMVVSVVIGSGILVAALVAICFICLAKRGETEVTGRDIQLHDQNLQVMENLNSQRFLLETLMAATDNFSESNKLGEGGFGPVYKGWLPDGKEVAVKRLLSGSDQGADEFTNEVLFILQLQHKNLVKLLGFCVDGEEKLLIYEYMPNGSLDVFLFDSQKSSHLDWIRRKSIIDGIARGVLYLHEDSRLRIIHRDLKASNILLDSEMTPKISDFGMARIFGGNCGEASTGIIVGTYGYMAPEYAMEGLYSIKSDVFSFGVLLLELITGKRNAGFHLSKLAPSLLAYVWQLWNKGRGMELGDPSLNDSCDPGEFLRYVHIGLLCVQQDACDRPTMSMVVVMLKREVATLSQPGRPALSVGTFADHYETNDIYDSANGLTTSSSVPQ